MVDLEKLVGVKVRRATIHAGDVFLDTDAGVYVLVPEGDCCAHCFIEHVEGAEFLQDATITAVQDVESGAVYQASDENGQEAVEQWGHLFTTDKGHVRLDMRVEHNGYYGGWLRVSKTPAMDGDVLIDF